MTISYLDPLTRAWNRMLVILFHPFDLVKWLVLGFSAWLAGLASGGGGGGRLPAMDLDELDDGFSGLSDAAGSLSSFFASAVLLPLVAFIVVVVVALVILLVWLSSRGKFIFLDNLVHNRAAIVEPWRRFARLGNSLFLWRLGLGVVALVVFGAVVLLMVGPAIALGGFEELSFAAMLATGLLAGVGGILFAYVALFLESFVVPIMYRYDLGATAAWRAFLPWLSSQGLWFLLYGPFVLVLFMLFAVVFLVGCVLTCCIVLLPYVGTVLLLPAIVTYRLLSVEFLAQLDAGFDLFAPPAVTDAAADS